MTDVLRDACPDPAVKNGRIHECADLVYCQLGGFDPWRSDPEPGGQRRFRAYSAGSHPLGVPNPLAIELLASLGYPIADLRSKSWDEFARPGAPVFELVITVCDAAAGEACPLRSGTPFKVHWGIPDPAGAPCDIDAEHAAFRVTYDRLLALTMALAALPVETMSPQDVLPRPTRIAKFDGLAAR